jgi:hypothetical protein
VSEVIPEFKDAYFLIETDGDTLSVKYFDGANFHPDIAWEAPGAEPDAFRDFVLSAAVAFDIPVRDLSQEAETYEAPTPDPNISEEAYVINDILKEDDG